MPAPQLWDCHSGRNQAWTYTSQKALLLHDSKCLDALGKGTSANQQRTRT